MDLSTLEVPETADVHIEHPKAGKLYTDGDKGKPVIITVHGPASDAAVKQRRKATNELHRLIAKKGKKGFGQRSAEESEEDEVQRLVALTSSVSNLEYNGEEITPQNIDQVYSDPKMGWLVDQIKGKLLSWEDFLA